MHEVNIARQIAEKVTSEAHEAKAKSVVAVEVELGDLSLLDPENIAMWLKQALSDGLAQNTTVDVRVVTSEIACSACGFTGEPVLPEYHDHHLPLPAFDCPRCGSSDVSLVKEERDCILKRIELEL